ncbi:TetR family transcriptional regulator [Streptomyces albiaxialis]|uniref:TetR family transcriptional regulator n=1 Tax=Streptomyces albiaxialis TaxID=329523 RepID=A0ABN2VXN1_9ACTN
MSIDATAAQTPPAGLRETKKQETRQLLSDAATRLFLDQGFERTTIAEIAAAARVAKKTVTNYFPRKEDLALDHQDAFVGSLARTVADRAPGESALTALRRAFAEAADTTDPVAGFAPRDFARMIADSPTLTARLRDLHDLREAALAEALAKTTGVGAGADAGADTGAGADARRGDLAARTAAALFGAVHRMLFERVQRLTLDGRDAAEIRADVTAAAEHAFALLEPSLGDYATA